VCGGRRGRGGARVAGWFIGGARPGSAIAPPALRGATWLVGALPLALPILAFASGGGPPNAVDTLPASTIQGIEAGIVGIIDAPAGRYEVVAPPRHVDHAHLSSGHETFDARFPGAGGGIRGSWQGDPHDFTRPVTAEISRRRGLGGYRDRPALDPRARGNIC